MVDTVALVLVSEICTSVSAADNLAAAEMPVEEGEWDIINTPAASLTSGTTETTVPTDTTSTGEVWGKPRSRRIGIRSSKMRRKGGGFGIILCKEGAYKAILTAVVGKEEEEEDEDDGAEDIEGAKNNTTYGKGEEQEDVIIKDR